MAATKRQTEAITLHDRSMVVTAGAGTGKTFVLVQKYIDLIDTKGVSVPEILALTFTDKAAAEMKERIRKELSEHRGQKWEKATEDFMVAPVQTFHSFCAQVLREFPIESGLDPGFVVLDEQEASRFHVQAFEDLIHTVQDDPVNSAIVAVLSSSDQYTLRSMLSEMYGKRTQFARFFDALNADEKSVVDLWRTEVHQFRDAEIKALLEDRSFRSAVEVLLGLAESYEGVEDKAAAFLQEIRPHLEAISKFTSAVEFCGAASAILQNRPGNIGSRKNWNENDLETFKKVRRDLYEILERKRSLFRMTVDPGDPLIVGSLRFLHDLSLVFDRYKALVEERKGTRGGLDFSDLIFHARELFTGQRELVATHFMKRFRYILVDEFQDTDLAQFDIILSIIGTPDPSTDCLFIVGDPKQSIYLFRDADVTRFKEAQSIIQSACKGRVVDLDISFRSTKEVIGLTNILFSKLFASADKPWEFGYEPIRTSESRAEHEGQVELLLPPDGTDSASRKRNEADLVARKIHSLIHAGPVDVYEEKNDHSFIMRPAQFGDIAVLLEQRTNLSYYLAALSRYGIPFYVHGGTGFYCRQEVYDMYNVLSFLEHRHNDVSLFGILRSPYFGLSDADLFSIAQERGRTFWEKLCRYAENSGSVIAIKARDLLALWQSYAGRCRLVPLLRRILEDSGVYTVYRALPEGDQILANIEKMVGMARNREESGAYGIPDFTADLRIAMEEEEREGEAPLDALAENAVNIMTVHAAKGLEFPIVFVPDMGMAFRERYPPIMIGDNPLLVGVKVPNPEENYEPAESAVLTVLREMQRQKERAERKRLLYVALTRARDHLFMSGTIPEDPEMSFNLARNRIEWIFSALGITGDAIVAGELILAPDDGTKPTRLTITSDPAAIPAETGQVNPELIMVPEECAGKNGMWIGVEYSPEPDLYQVITVSELEEKSGVQHLKRPEVQSKYLVSVDGTTKGTIIHEVLRGRDARVVCEEYGVNDPEAVRQCEEIVARFHSSELMQRVKREFCELPFVITIEDMRISGKIDRLCELDDGSWVVVDYKSEEVSRGEYESLAGEYAFQVGVYVKAARQMLGGKPVVSRLYFTETGDFWQVKNDDDNVISMLQ